MKRKNKRKIVGLITKKNIEATATQQYHRTNLCTH